MKIHILSFKTASRLLMILFLKKNRNQNIYIFAVGTRRRRRVESCGELGEISSRRGAANSALD